MHMRWFVYSTFYGNENDRSSDAWGDDPRHFVHIQTWDIPRIVDSTITSVFYTVHWWNETLKMVSIPFDDDLALRHNAVIVFNVVDAP